MSSPTSQNHPSEKSLLKSLSRCVLTPYKKMTKGQRNRQTAPYRQPRNRDRNMAVWQLHPTDRWRRVSAGRTAWDRKIQSTASLARSPWDNGVGGYNLYIIIYIYYMYIYIYKYHISLHIYILYKQGGQQKCFKNWPPNFFHQLPHHFPSIKSLQKSWQPQPTPPGPRTPPQK